MKVAIIILAAGSSSRFARASGVCDANKLLQVFPQPDSVAGNVLDRTLKCAIAVSPDQLVVITGHQRAQINLVAAPYPGVTCVHNVRHATDEMTSSLQCGLRALGEGIDAAFVMLADLPAVLPGTLTALHQRMIDIRCAAVVPEFEGQRGHPVLFARHCFADLLALPSSETPREVLRRQTAHVILVAVKDRGIVLDVDTPEALETARKHVLATDTADVGES